MHTLNSTSYWRDDGNFYDVKAILDPPAPLIAQGPLSLTIYPRGNETVVQKEGMQPGIDVEHVGSVMIYSCGSLHLPH